MTVPRGLAAVVTAVLGATRRLLGVLGANLTLRSSACHHAIRLAVAATLASAVARALGLPHDYWVPLTVLWLLRPDFGSTFTRGVQRYVGTTAGAVLATLFAATVHPGPYALSTLATALSVGIFCFMLANYAVAGACTTGWVVLVSALAGIPELRAAADRVLDTSLGAVIALGCYLLWPTWERGEVGDMVADVIDAARRYAAVVLDSWLNPEKGDRDAIERCRTDARVIRTNAEATLTRSIAEPANSPAGLDPDVAAGLLSAMRRFCDGPLALEQSLGQLFRHIDIQWNAFARAAEQHSDARLRQVGEGGAGLPAILQPGVVNLVERADGLQYIGPAEPVVPRRDYGIPVRRIDARVQDLHGVTATAGKSAQLTGEQRGGATATDRHSGPGWREQYALGIRQRELSAKGESRCKP